MGSIPSSKGGKGMNLYGLTQKLPTVSTEVQPCNPKLWEAKAREFETSLSYIARLHSFQEFKNYVQCIG